MELTRNAVSAGAMVAVLAALILSVAGCKEKTPYPSLENLRKSVSGEPDKSNGRTVEREPEVDSSPVRPLALVRSLKGTVMISGRASGENLTFQQFPYYVHASDDGFVRIVKVKARAPKVNTSKKRSSLSTLVLEEYGPDGVRTRSVDLIPEHSAGHVETEANIKEAIEADPDLAGEFYHVEEIRSLGSSGAWSTWILNIDSYLGGNHPSSSQKVIVVDADKASVVGFDGLFAGRDVVRELLKDDYEAACVRKNCGIAPLEGRGGELVWVAFLCAEFAACEGHVNIKKIKPSEDADREPVEKMVLQDGALSVPDVGTVVRGVVDFRVAADGGMAVIEMALGNKDEVQYPWVPGKVKGDRGKTREVRFWSSGMKDPAVVSRMPDIQSVQFLSEHKHLDEMVSAIKGIGK